MDVNRILKTKNAMKDSGFLKLPILCLLLAVLCSSARASITVLDYYRLGEDDPGAASGADFTSTRDDVRTNHLTVFDAPFWTTDVSSAASAHTASVFSMQFFQGGPYGICSNVLTTATGNFGIEAWVKPNTTSGNHCIAYNGSTASNGWGL